MAEENRQKQNIPSKNKLKSAFDLAMERVIASTYTPPPETDEWGNEPEYEEPEIKHDFVDSWKRPDSDIPEPELIMVENESRYEKPPEEKLDIHTISKKTYSLENKPDVYYHGCFHSYNGEGRTNRAIAFGLGYKDIKVKINPLPCTVNINENTQNELKLLGENMVSKPIHIYQSSIRSQYDPHDINVFYSYFENEQDITEDIIKTLNNFREIWVPSNFNRQMLEKSEISCNIEVIPLGVDISRYNQNATPVKLDEKLNDFVILHLVDNMTNLRYVIHTYLETISSDDNVTLLLVFKRDEEGQILLNIKNIFAEVRDLVKKKDSELPHVHLYDKPIPERYMPGLYSMANILIDINSNGFGLSILENSAIGKPSIVGNIGGHLEFINHNCNLVVNMENEDNILAELQEKIIQAINDYEVISKHSLLYSKNIQKQYSWDNTMDMIYERLLELNRR